MNDKLKLGGRWRLECYNPDGSRAWSEPFPNGATTQGLTNLLSVYFAGGSQTATWRIGLIDALGFDELSVTDTMASHSGWSENTDYSEVSRPDWAPTTPSGGLIASNLPATFTMTAGPTIQGAFLTSSATKGGAVGTLWATGELSTPRTVVAGQLLKLSYECAATGA